MPDLPTSLYRVDQVRELDRRAIVQHGIPGITLMERAGRAAWECCAEAWPEAGNVIVLCGGGNNGGDGYVFGRRAVEQGWNVRLIALAPYDALQGDARTAAGGFLSTGQKPESFSAAALNAADVIIDALLGTGLDRDVSDRYWDVIEAVNDSGKPVLAVDIPSGLNADSGAVMGTAVNADMTVTFVGLKLGLYCGTGPDRTGCIRFSDLDVPPEIYAGVPPAARRIDLAVLRDWLPKRRRSAHKGDFGHVLVVGGDYGFAGAARLAGEAAVRVGSGLVSIATRPEPAAWIPMARPELMAHGVVSAVDLIPLLERATVIAVGPGLGRTDWAAGLLSRLLERSLPMVMDADALNLLARDPCRRGNWILTPHPGEAARLLGTTSAAIQSDRFGAAAALQERYGGVAVLKGCGTVIAAGDGEPAVCSGGNPGMASGGMGDVLTGVIAGLLAQGLTLPDAARVGVCLQAAAADRCASDGERGMLAGDLMAVLRRLANPEQ